MISLSIVIMRSVAAALASIRALIATHITVAGDITWSIVMNQQQLIL